MDLQRLPYLLPLLAVLIVATALALYIWRHRVFPMLGITPLAHAAIMASVHDGMIVLDTQDRVVGLNPAAQRIMGSAASQMIGRPAAQVLSPWPELRERFLDVTEVQAEITLGTGDAQHDYDLRISSLVDGRGHRTGRLAVLHDITKHKRAEDELRAQKQLFESLVAVARATAEQPTLEATLQNALDVAATLTGAESASLFLLDKTGAVTHSILARDAQTMTPKQRQDIITRVMGEGLAGWVARHRQAAVITDTSLDERWISLPDEPYPVRSALVVPLLSRQALVGILTLTHSQPERLNDEHARLMQAAADQMTLAVRNAQIFDAQRRMAEQQATLSLVFRAVSGQLDPGAVTRIAVEATTEFTGWPHVAIATPDDDHSHWAVRAASGALSFPPGTERPLGHSTVGRAFRTGRTQLVPDVSADPDYIAGHPAIRSEMIIPLRRGERVLGVLSVESDRPDAFDSDDVLLGELLAEAIALAMDNARLYTETLGQAAILNALYAITSTTSRSLALEDVLAQTLSSSAGALGFEGGMICLADLADWEATGKAEGRRPLLRLAAQRGLPQALIESIQVNGLEGTLCAYAHNRDEVVTISDLCQEAPAGTGNMAADMAALGWRAFAGIPLLFQGQSLGVIGLFSRQPGASSAYGLALLTTIGHQVAAAIENARLFRATLNERCRLQALIKSSRDGVLLIGADGRVLVINAPALQLLHLPGQPEEWLGRPTWHLLRVLRRHALAVVKAALSEMRRVRKGDEPLREAEHTVPPYVIHWVNLPVLAGAMPLGRLLVLRDVSNERAIEQMREDMTHMMVHDLRSPLGVVYGALDLLNLSAISILRDDQREALELALIGARKMRNVVNSILDISRLENGQITLERVAFRLDDLIGETVRSQASLASVKGLRLESDVSPTLPLAWADVELIARVLQNLVDNAIKFTPEGGMIQVTAKVDEVDGRSVLLVAVSNSGPGIPVEIQGQLFQKFVTGRQAGRGTGLGLAFCKLVIEAHGERIWVESMPGRGTTLTFSLAPFSGS